MSWVRDAMRQTIRTSPADAPITDSVEMPEADRRAAGAGPGHCPRRRGRGYGPAFLVVGGVLLIVGLGLWIAQLLPGRGHLHEPLVEPCARPSPVQPAPGTVEQIAAGHARLSLRLPEEVHPISAGVKGGIVGGLVMPLPALAYGVLSGHGIWYPVNLLAGMVLPGMGA